MFLNDKLIPLLLKTLQEIIGKPVNQIITPPNTQCVQSLLVHTELCNVQSFIVLGREPLCMPACFFHQM